MPPDQVNIDSEELFERYRSLQHYVGWQPEDAGRIETAAPVVLPHLDALGDDFYEEIQRHEPTRSRITGGQEQVQRLKGTLATWLRDLLAAKYDEDYVRRRWLVGWRHVEIGLRQVYVNAALSRLRGGILQAFHDGFTGDDRQRFEIAATLHKVLDLDLAIIQDAYEAEKHSRSEAAFRSLVEAADCAIFILREDYRIAYLNPFAQKMTGYSLGEVQRREFLELLLRPNQRDSVAAEFAGVLRGEPTLGRELTVYCRSGQPHQLVWNVRRLNDFAGSPAILGVGHDISDLQQAQNRALQAERLAAIGQTMAGLAHESRNAFQRIQACLEMLQLEVDDRPEAMELVQRIQRAQNHLHQLNEEVRSYAAPIRLDKQACDLRSIWREVWQHLELSRRESQMDLREPAADVACNCEADPFAIGQVLRNVLENAIAACGEQGDIVIKVEPTGLDGERSAIAVEIQDSGPGIPEDVRERIFEPFFTTKAKGTGLGMAIAKRIVEAHGGKISAHPNPARGAQIRIILPR